MKTLVVSYLPRGERSHTKKLLDAFLETTDSDVEHLNLLEDLPDVFLSDNLLSYVKRHYLGEELSGDEKASLAKMDRMTRQLKAADLVVLAFPMHNFSFPAVVKGWFDSVMQKGETWDIDENGYVQLMTGKKALVLMASGGIYEGDTAGYEHAVSLARVEFGFMGFETHVITAAGMNMLPNPEEALQAKQDEVRKLAASWQQKQAA